MDGRQEVLDHDRFLAGGVEFVGFHQLEPVQQDGAHLRRVVEGEDHQRFRKVQLYVLEVPVSELVRLRRVRQMDEDIGDLVPFRAFGELVQLVKI